ncbi:MAG: two-component regulator propeller domain-containing protein, partial [Eubacteriales bacterium]
MKRIKGSLAAYALLVLICLAVNWGGDQIVSRLNWPVWLDSIGTIVCAYIAGPFCGVVVGITTNLLAHILYGIPWFYAIVSVVIALIVGFAARKRMLHTLLGTLNVGVVLAVSTSVVAFVLNLILNNGSTGSAWGDAVKGFLTERGLNPWVSLFIGEIYMEMADKLAILLVLFLVTRLVFGIWFKIHPEKLEQIIAEQEALTRTTAILLAVGLALTATAAVPARAEGDNVAIEVNYNDYVQTIYSSLNGLPCGEANDIAITGDGIMWIGTYAGLYRYQGREFRWMDNYDSVRNVNCLYVDEEGRLWIGTNDNGLSIVINEQMVNVIDQSQGL